MTTHATGAPIRLPTAQFRSSRARDRDVYARQAPPPPPTPALHPRRGCKPRSPGPPPEPAQYPYHDTASQKSPSRQDGGPRVPRHTHRGRQGPKNRTTLRFTRASTLKLLRGMGVEAHAIRLASFFRSGVHPREIRGRGGNAHHETLVRNRRDYSSFMHVPPSD